MPKRSDTALDWLLEENQPSIRYLALTQLLDRPENDGEVQIAKEIIGKTGWAADILGAQKPGGWWVSDERLYQPKYTSTNWMLLILSDLGLTKADPRIARACGRRVPGSPTPCRGSRARPDRCRPIRTFVSKPIPPPPRAVGSILAVGT